MNLTLIWMALVVLQSPNDKIELQDLGKSYLKEFCARSFCKYIENDEDTQFIM